MGAPMADRTHAAQAQSSSAESLASAAKPAAKAALPRNQVAAEWLLTHVQPKLTVNQPNDKYEVEADRVADQVMRMSNANLFHRNDAPRGKPRGFVFRKEFIRKPLSPTQATGNAGKRNHPSIQRACVDCEEEIQRNAIGTLEVTEEEEEIQLKRNSNNVLKAPPNLTGQLQNLSGKGQPMSSQLRSFFEPRFGRSFSDVHMHRDAQAGEMADQLQAKAFTWKNNILFAGNQFNPHSQSGKWLIAHELTHVLQQADGLSPTIQREEGDEEEAPPPDCDHAAALTWTDFTGSVPSSSSYAAFTSTRVRSIANNTRFQAQFRAGSSWVKNRYKLADRRMFSGIPQQVTSCENYFQELDPDVEGAYYDITYSPSGTPCPASFSLPETFRATSEGDCTQYGTDADTAGANESARLLAHEQRHYDITCQFAARANQLLGTGSSFTDLRAKINARLQPIQEQYDDETTHGCDPSAQSTWDSDYVTKVNDEFSDLESSSNEEGETTSPTPTTE